MNPPSPKKGDSRESSRPSTPVGGAPLLQRNIADWKRILQNLTEPYKTTIQNHYEKLISLSKAIEQNSGDILQEEEQILDLEEKLKSNQQRINNLEQKLNIWQRELNSLPDGEYKNALSKHIEKIQECKKAIEENSIDISTAAALPREFLPVLTELNTKDAILTKNLADIKELDRKATFWTNQLDNLSGNAQGSIKKHLAAVSELKKYLEENSIQNINASDAESLEVINSSSSIQRQSFYDNDKTLLENINKIAELKAILPHWEKQRKNLPDEEYKKSIDQHIAKINGLITNIQDHINAPQDSENIQQLELALKRNSEDIQSLNSLMNFWGGLLLDLNEFAPNKANIEKHIKRIAKAIKNIKNNSQEILIKSTRDNATVESWQNDYNTAQNATKELRKNDAALMCTVTTLKVDTLISTGSARAATGEEEEQERRSSSAPSSPTLRRSSSTSSFSGLSPPSPSPKLKAQSARGAQQYPGKDTHGKLTDLKPEFARSKGLKIFFNGQPVPRDALENLKENDFLESSLGDFQNKDFLQYYDTIMWSAAIPYMLASLTDEIKEGHESELMQPKDINFNFVEIDNEVYSICEAANYKYIEDKVLPGKTFIVYKFINKEPKHFEWVGIHATNSLLDRLINAGEGSQTVSDEDIEKAKAEEAFGGAVGLLKASAEPGGLPEEICKQIIKGATTHAAPQDLRFLAHVAREVVETQSPATPTLVSEKITEYFKIISEVHEKYNDVFTGLMALCLFATGVLFITSGIGAFFGLEFIGIAAELALPMIFGGSVSTGVSYLLYDHKQYSEASFEEEAKQDKQHRLTAAWNRKITPPDETVNPQIGAAPVSTSDTSSSSSDLKKN